MEKRKDYRILVERLVKEKTDLEEQLDKLRKNIFIKVYLKFFSWNMRTAF